MALINNKNFSIRRQMILSLLIILAFACFNFGFDKINILIPHLLTAILVAYTSDSIIKYILKKRIYFNETALITGLIVAMIIDPKTSLFLTALISFLGILSKNFITIKKRHIFNPAAFGIVAVALLFPEISQSWWIGNSIYPIFILGVFILYRLGRFSTFITYIITFFILKIIFDFFSGDLSNIISDLWLSLSKFFIFFMLIEPQTSPSIKHKKITFGIIAAIFTFISLNIPVISSLGDNGILIGLLIANLYFILSQFYKESQVKIIANFIAIALFITIISYTNSGKNETIGNINKETNKMMGNMSNNMGKMMKVVKLPKSYMSPGGKDKVSFNISTFDGKIQNIETVKIKTNKTSAEYIKIFNEEIGNVVKGKTLEEVKDIDIVGGASLTTNAFKKAVKGM